MVEGTRLKEVDLLAKENRSKLEELQIQFSQLTDRVTESSKSMEDRFEELFKLLGKDTQKGKDKVDANPSYAFSFVPHVIFPQTYPTLNPNLHPGAQGSLLRPPKLDLPRFDGNNPRVWAKKCLKFFSLHPMADEQKIVVASLYMEGKVDSWFLDYQAGKGVMQWDEMIEDMCGRFEDIQKGNYVGNFNNSHNQDM